jgi:hypothetical protein
MILEEFLPKKILCIRFHCYHPPPNGSSPALSVYGGAQRGILLATGFFTGESRRKPPRRREKQSHDIAETYVDWLNSQGGFYYFCQESTPWNPGKPPEQEASQRKPPIRKPLIPGGFRLTKLPPLTYLLIIEE